MSEGGRTVWLPAYESHFNLLFERRRKESWMANTCKARDDCKPYSAAQSNRRLTSWANVSASAVDDLSPRPCLLCVGLGGGGRESRERFVVECQVAVVGAVDMASEDWETVDSSRLTPTMAGYVFSARALAG